MARNKDPELKEFLITTRKKISASITNAPVWVLQKAGRRIFNPKQKRHWRHTTLGKEYRKREKEEYQRAFKVKSGKHYHNKVPRSEKRKYEGSY
ncbi:MAG: hypothetical protein HY393_03665 [Candidatus Diapherotrites archaeon]|nr:hypothetical protein [Candidatus Diapherotrites archaeon]